jgi:branched-chain amino acid transport system substrate-binding protein
MHKTENIIKIGAILPLTGRLAVIGQGEQKGILLGLDILKEEFGEKSIQLFFEDFASETKNAVTAANKLIKTHKVDAIITSTTAGAEAVSPVIDANKVIHFVISPDADILSRSEYNFRIYYNFIAEAKIVQDFLLKSKTKDLSILAVTYSSIQKEIEEFIEPFAEKQNIKILSKDFFDITVKDFKTLIAKAKGQAPTIIFLAPQVNQVELLANQMLEANFGPTDSRKIICSFTFNWRPYSYIQTLEGFYILSPKFQVDGNKNIYAQKFSEKYNQEPSFDMMYAFDNIIILANILKKQPKDLTEFKNYFDSYGDYTGASGKINFVGNRDTAVEIVLTKIEGGKQVLVQ